jgi:hypothetical protein
MITLDNFIMSAAKYLCTDTRIYSTVLDEKNVALDMSSNDKSI